MRKRVESTQDTAQLSTSLFGSGNTAPLPAASSALTTGSSPEGSLGRAAVPAQPLCARLGCREGNRS